VACQQLAAGQVPHPGWMPAALGKRGTTLHSTWRVRVTLSNFYDTLVFRNFRFLEIVFRYKKNPLGAPHRRQRLLRPKIKGYWHTQHKNTVGRIPHPFLCVLCSQDTVGMRVAQRPDSGIVVDLYAVDRRECIHRRRCRSLGRMELDPRHLRPRLKPLNELGLPR